MTVLVLALALAVLVYLLLGAWGRRQRAAQCLLVEEVYGVRPPYGLLVLAGGVQERVPFTPALERRRFRWELLTWAGRERRPVIPRTERSLR